MSERTNNQSALLKKACLAIQDLEVRREKSERGATEPIAIVGIGCRFPGGAHDAESFWEILRSGRDVISETPRDRWAADGTSARRAAFLEQVDGFDAGFFGMAPREVAAVDPQQRLVLEVALETLENAGIAAGRLQGTKAGVFVGIAGNDFSHRFAQAG